MPNFLLTFRTETIEEVKGKRIRRESYDFDRVISAPSYEIALKIAKAMIGEEVYCIPVYLSEVLSVKKTKQKPFGLNTLCDCYPWERVLGKLRFYLHEELHGEPAFNGFKYFSVNSYRGRPCTKIKVGLRLNKIQRERLLSINL